MERQERCRRIVSAINQLGQTQIDELFKLLHNNKCLYTRNTNGIFVNLSWLTDELIAMIEQYVSFCNESRTEVFKYESLCEALNRNLTDTSVSIEALPKNIVAQYPGNDITIDATSVAAVAAASGTSSRVSSSMKFYLLKKKFAKQSNFTSQINIKNDLRHEAYVL